MATSSVKSNIPVRGMMRRSGDSRGSTILSRIIVIEFGRGENQHRIALIKIASVSTSALIRIKVTPIAIDVYFPTSLA